MPRLHRSHSLVGWSEDEGEIVVRAIEPRQNLAQRDESGVAAHEFGAGRDVIQVGGELPGAGVDLLPLTLRLHALGVLTVHGVSFRSCS